MTIHQLAAQQHGLVTRQQLLAAGHTKSAIRWKVSRGELLRLHERVFAFPGGPLTWERSAMLGLLVAGDDAALSHLSAAWVYGLDAVVRPKELEVCVGATAPDNFEATRFHRRRHGFGVPEVRRGFRVTHIARTLIDLASVLSRERLEHALDSARRQYWNLEELIDTTVRHLSSQAMPGIPTLLELLAERTGSLTESNLEVDVSRILRREGFPAWKEQVVICDDAQEFIMRSDFAWPAHRVVLLPDGFRWHSQRARMARDARQRSWLQAAGWKYVVVTDSSVKERGWRDDLRFLLRPQLALRLDRGQVVP